MSKLIFLLGYMVDRILILKKGNKFVAIKCRPYFNYIIGENGAIYYIKFHKN